MPLFDLVLLALIQGVTEFLPISSSGHLALYPLLSGGRDQGQALDVAVHVGSLAAVLIYFRADVARIARGGHHVLSGRTGSAEARLTLLLAVATVPVVLAGLALKMFGLTDALRSIAVIGWATIIGGALLWWFDARAAQARGAGDWRLGHALVMGAAQACALVPGASRSGVTMTAARALGYDRVAAAHLSMLMSIPTIIAAGTLIGLELWETGDAALGWDAALAALLAFAAALAAIAGLMRMMRAWSMTGFALYRFVLGAALLWLAYA